MSNKEKKSLKIIMKYYKKHMFLYISFLIITISKAVISFFSAMFIAKLIANMMDLNYEEVMKYALLNLIILCINHILSAINVYFYKNLENGVRYDLEQDIIKQTLDIKMSFYDSFGSGVILTRLTSDIDNLTWRFKSITEYLVNITRRISFLIYIFVLDFYLGLFVSFSVLLITIAYSIRIHYFSKLKPEVIQRRENINSKIIEIIRAIKDIKTLGCDENILNMISKEQREYIKKDNREFYIGSRLCDLTNLVITICDFSFIIISIALMKNYGLTTTIFYTCFLYKDHTFNLANDIGDFRYQLAECKVSAKRICSLIYPEVKNIDGYGKEYVENYKGDITFKNVKFLYNNNLIFNGLSFNIKPKTTVALVGESGAGKSTIASLIGHLYYKDSGEILLGNKDIDKLSKEFIRNNIVIVNQFPYLFNLSIRENFKIVNNDISDEEIWNLCDKVLMKDYIESLPNKLDSVIGEGGCQLSGGQKQKLCIARALCRDVKVMIFDEATSSLDNNSQEEIMQVIQKLKKQITIIIVAHRLSTITYSDSIILIKDGTLVAMDTHDNLLKNNAYYKSLYLNSISE